MNTLPVYRVGPSACVSPAASWARSCGAESGGSKRWLNQLSPRPAACQPSRRRRARSFPCELCAAFRLAGGSLSSSQAKDDERYRAHDAARPSTGCRANAMRSSSRYQTISYIVAGVIVRRMRRWLLELGLRLGLRLGLGFAVPARAPPRTPAPAARTCRPRRTPSAPLVLARARLQQADLAVAALAAHHDHAHHDPRGRDREEQQDERLDRDARGKDCCVLAHAVASGGAGACGRRPRRDDCSPKQSASQERGGGLSNEVELERRTAHARSMAALPLNVDKTCQIPTGARPAARHAEAASAPDPSSTPAMTEVVQSMTDVGLTM